MSELKIPEVILRERRKKNLTQEELAASLGVSSQAISNWERGGYPDITLLPRIANFFGITVDELIGNDAVTKEEDLNSFERRWSKADPSEKVRLSKEYWQKYPGDFLVGELLANAIANHRPSWETDYPLMKEVCEKILSECTWEYTRHNAIEFMCIVCTDEEWKEKWCMMCPQFYGAQEHERLEERYWERREYERYRSQSECNDALVMQHFLGREYMRYYERNNGDLFRDPAKTAERMACRMRVIEAISGDGTVPEAWRGCYADLCLKLAGAMIGDGRLDEGFAALDRAFRLYEEWLKIPEGKRMDTGIGSTTVNKCDSRYWVDVQTEDGTSTWSPYLWLFWQRNNDIERALNGWPWFEGVREDARYRTAYERAKTMAGMV